MASKNIELTREEFNLIAEKRGIQEPQKMSTKELLNTLRTYDSRHKVKNSREKLLKIKLEKIAKLQNISKIELSKAEITIDELQGIARLRRIKSYDNLTKEDLIISQKVILWNVII